MKLFFCRIAGQILVVRAESWAAADRIVRDEFAKVLKNRTQDLDLLELEAEGKPGIVVDVTG